MNNPFGPFQDLVSHVPEIVQPLLVALLGAIPFVDEAATGLGIVAGMHPLVAFTANAVGSSVSVVLVVLLGSRVRGAILARRVRSSASVTSPDLVPAAHTSAVTAGTPLVVTSAVPQHQAEENESKGKKRLAGWLVRFGVPGASILAPLALPFSFTALFFISSGVKKSWVILWQLIAIVLWTAVVTASATAAVAMLSN
ncbi:hypothetical protein B7R21_16810 [Subtercola boreus]|uniref:Small multidrug efflux protein n=1 Tax=Subtercola boreus TaxID=120213 RepID=A0A3E0VC87_9MICO|nr:small multidrug efflux protein [Subtercola boreus]RFA07118.1 hypothetical protein B7R21_16810 [Subtercola boreus]